MGWAWKWSYLGTDLQILIRRDGGRGSTVRGGKTMLREGAGGVISRCLLWMNVLWVCEHPPCRPQAQVQSPPNPVFTFWTWLVVISCPKAQFPAHSLEPGCWLRKGTCCVDGGDTTKVQQRLHQLGTRGGAAFRLLWSASAPGGDPTPSPPPREELEMFPAPFVRCRPGSSFP